METHGHSVRASKYIYIVRLRPPGQVVARTQVVGLRWWACRPTTGAIAPLCLGLRWWACRTLGPPLCLLLLRSSACSSAAGESFRHTIYHRSLHNRSAGCFRVPGAGVRLLRAAATLLGPTGAHRRILSAHRVTLFAPCARGARDAMALSKLSEVKTVGEDAALWVGE